MPDIDVGDVIARMKLDSSNIEMGLRRVNTALKASADDAQQRFGEVRSAVDSASNGMLAAGAAGVTASLGIAVLGGQLEQTQVAFEVMLGNAELAKSTLASLQQFAAKTPFQTDLILSSARALLAFGGSANTVVDELRRIGDVAAGTQTPLNELATIYGKARVQGRLYMEDVNQLTGRGIPILQEFANQFGVTQDMVRGLVESGKIGFPQLEQAFISMTSEGGKFAGMMDRQATTTLGKWSTIVSDFKQGAAEIGTSMKPTFDTIEGVMGKVTAALKGMSDEQKRSLGNMLLWGSAGLLAAGGALKLGLGVTTLLSNLRSLGIVFGAAEGAAGGMGAFLAGLSGPVGWTIAAVVAVGASLVAAYKYSEQFRNAVNGAFQQVMSAGKQVYAAVAGPLSGVWASLKDAAKAALDFLVQYVTWWGNNVTAFWQAWGPTIVSTFKAVWDAVGPLVTTALNGVADVMRTLGYLISGNWKALWTQLQINAVDGATGVLNALRAAMKLYENNPIFGAVARFGISNVDATLRDFKGMRDLLASELPKSPLAVAVGVTPKTTPTAPEQQPVKQQVAALAEAVTASKALGDAEVERYRIEQDNAQRLADAQAEVDKAKRASVYALDAQAKARAQMAMGEAALALQYVQQENAARLASLQTVTAARIKAESDVVTAEQTLQKAKDAKDDVAEKAAKTALDNIKEQAAQAVRMAESRAQAEQTAMENTHRRQLDAIREEDRERLAAFEREKSVALDLMSVFLGNKDQRKWFEMGLRYSGGNMPTPALATPSAAQSSGTITVEVLDTRDGTIRKIARQEIDKAQTGTLQFMLTTA